MKIRKGFVSNSSSSSFICDITGSVESGYDASLSDVEMCRCINDHTFLHDGYPDVEEWISENGRYSLPAELCPICNGDKKTKQIIIDRIKSEMKNLGVTLDDLK